MIVVVSEAKSAVASVEALTVDWQAFGVDPDVAPSKAERPPLVGSVMGRVRAMAACGPGMLE